MFVTGWHLQCVSVLNSLSLLGQAYEWVDRLKGVDRRIAGDFDYVVKTMEEMVDQYAIKVSDEERQYTHSWSHKAESSIRFMISYLLHNEE